MAKLLKLRRGTTSQHNTFTGAEGEVTIDTTKDTAVVHDGSQAGGRPLAREDMSNVSSSSIAGRLGADSIAVTKIAGGTLPSDVKVEHGNIIDGTVRNAEINASAAIAGTKISPNFGSQDISTTGDIRANSASSTIGIGNVSGDNYVEIQQETQSTSVRGFTNQHGCASVFENKQGTTEEYIVLGDTSHDSNSSLMGVGTTDGSTYYNRLNLSGTGNLDITGNLTLGGTVDGRNVANDGSKLDGIESGATADQSASEILTLVKTVDGSGSGLDADTLDGLQPSTGTGSNTIVQRNGSGYVFANYFNTTANDVSSGVTKIMCETGNDNYIRHADAGAVRSFINVENGATADQSDAEIVSALSGQHVSMDRLGITGGHGIDNAGWFRNNSSGEGMYNTATTQHWYSDNDDYWNVAGGGSANGIRFRDDHAGTVRGYVYANNSNQIGFLNNSGSWSLKCDNSGNVTATGNVTAYSDARLKTNVNTINDALSIVGKLRGVSFDWKETGKRSIGVIAQEVEAVLPELVVTQEVSTTENPELKEVKSVDYGKIVGVLINAINELKAEVDELKGGK